jgi:2-oxoacid:acceptor oxidoreductase gamma subunit (pyruvate/2-ketoisovalerate family)/2-oxoacid:acceptor oxidoreductase delta subunit (pyruvate/2-ketoisovalerate family)
MIEIRFHGRGGQGAVVASELLARAAFLDGREPQSFPFFGVERRGAPVTAYTRIDDRPIGVRTSIVAPDIVVVLDPGLLSTTPVADGLKDGGLLLVNSPHPPELLAAPASVRRASVDASAIAVAHGLGSRTMPIVNTTVLGALARASGVVSLEALGQAIDRYVPSRPVQNRAAAAEGFALVRSADAVAGGPTIPVGHVASPPTVLPEGPIASIPSRTIRTAAWRTLTPEIDLARCTKCNFCWKFCPDDAIEFDARGFPVIVLDACKGCGICADVCPPKTIAMVAVEVAA